MPNQISIWFSHELCLGVYANRIRWPGSLRNAARLAFDFSTPLLPFSSQVLLDPARLGHVQHQALRLVRVQVVHDEHPPRQRVGVHRLLDVRLEVLLRPRRPDASAR